MCVPGQQGEVAEIPGKGSHLDTREGRHRDSKGRGRGGGRGGEVQGNQVGVYQIKREKENRNSTEGFTGQQGGVVIGTLKGGYRYSKVGWCRVTGQQGCREGK